MGVFTLREIPVFSVAIYVKKIHEQIKEVLFLRKDKRNG